MHAVDLFDLPWQLIRYVDILLALKDEDSYGATR